MSQLQLRLTRPDSHRVREFRRGEEDAYLGHVRGTGTPDYHAGYRLGLEERQEHLAIQRTKTRSDTPNRTALSLLLRHR
jgi:hypothetical protein